MKVEEKVDFECDFPLYKILGCKWRDNINCSDCEYSTVKKNN